MREHVRVNSDLANRNVLGTGASSGIGVATASDQ
jgi:NAD(P)-dependent dehydrogenase (short-subunit alcohol dehydrogenase family)